MSTLKYCNLPVGNNVAKHDDGVRLDRWILSNFVLEDGTHVPEALLRKWIRLKKFRVQHHGSNDIAEGYITGTSKLPHGSKVLSDKEVQASLRPMQAVTDQATPAARAVGHQLVEQVLYLHEDLIAINKPAGLAVQSGTNVEVSVADALPSLARLLASRYDEPPPASGQGSGTGGTGAAAGEAGMLRLVHRLDRDVSGLLLLARSRQTAAQLSVAFRPSLESTMTDRPGTAAGMAGAAVGADDDEGQLEPSGVAGPDGSLLDVACPRILKQYIGLVPGPLPHGRASIGRVTTPVVHEEWQSSAQDSTGGAKSAKTAKGTAKTASKSKPTVVRTEWPAETSYEVVHSSQGLSVVLYSPTSGRKHQLRQHTVSLFGRPLLNDVAYGAQASAVANGAGAGTEGNAIGLHLASLTIPAGTLGGHQRRDILLSCPLPLSMRRMLQEARVPATALSKVGPKPVEPVGMKPGTGTRTGQSKME